MERAIGKIFDFNDVKLQVKDIEKRLVAMDAILINLSMSALMPIFQIIQDCALVRSVAMARM